MLEDSSSMDLEHSGGGDSSMMLFLLITPSMAWSAVCLWMRHPRGYVKTKDASWTNADAIVLERR